METKGESPCYTNFNLTPNPKPVKERTYAPMFRPFVSPEITDEAISERQSLYLQDPTTIESYHELYLHLCKPDRTIEATDGFIYKIDPDHPEQLIVIGARARTRGTSEFTCLADIIAPRAFAISPDEEGEGENDFIHTLHLPYCTSLAPDSFQGLCHIIQIDAPNLAEERFIKKLAEMLKKNEEALLSPKSEAKASTQPTPKKSRKKATKP